MRLLRVAALVLLPLAEAAGAHPHSYVDQQVQLSLGLERVEIAVVIVPSVGEGEAIFAHLDADADGAVSPEEAAGFGAAVVEGMRLVVDGQPVGLADPEVEVADADAIRGGNGAITVTAAASLDLGATGGHLILFEVTYGELSHEWFVQPFYDPAVMETFGTPGLERGRDGAQVMIRLGG